MKIYDNYDLLQWLIEKRLDMRIEHECIVTMNTLIEWAKKRLEAEND